MSKSQLAFLLRAKNRIKVLNALRNGQKISSQLEKEIEMYKSHICRTLKELQQKKLIRCINPEDRDFKFYKLTSEGKKVLQKANRILSELKK